MKDLRTSLALSEFMDLYNIDPALYDESLRWNTTNYAPAGLTTAVMPEGFFQNRTFTRVDRPPPSTPRYALSTSESTEGLSTTLVNQTLEARPAWTLQAAREALDKQGAAPSADDAALVRRLEELGVVPLYTFSDEVLMNKALARPTVELAMPARISPLTTTLSSHPYADASIVYLAGNLHDQRKAGGLRFTTFSARDDFVDMVLRGIRAPPRIREVGQRLAKRMAERVNGRRWVAAHLRRGDFVNIAWSPAKDALVHFDKTKKALDRGVGVLQEHFDSRLPLVDDPFYLATDETNTTALAYYRSRGAILLSDLFIPADTAALGWTSSYTDILAVVEQQVLAHADFFVGSELSSTSGGAINDRTALGKEEWSWSLLGRHD
ncbi:hypothetical protein Rhopal_000840-T1 [Rhodotorula paludigena]|uniref:Uncharacterized protein n=1 Tax=Rhodotorula paludigena TaxID=86838 RepID=A0AAV5GE08_9BASI|nr:hypothetical protein Rhopal_000840-T1 [Rhodotorula paludigena]